MVIMVAFKPDGVPQKKSAPIRGRNSASNKKPSSGSIPSKLPLSREEVSKGVRLGWDFSSHDPMLAERSSEGGMAVRDRNSLLNNAHANKLEPAEQNLLPRAKLSQSGREVLSSKEYSRGWEGVLEKIFNEAPLDQYGFLIRERLLDSHYRALDQDEHDGKYAVLRRIVVGQLKSRANKEEYNYIFGGLQKALDFDDVTVYEGVARTLEFLGVVLKDIYNGLDEDDVWDIYDDEEVEQLSPQRRAEMESYWTGFDGLKKAILEKCKPGAPGSYLLKLRAGMLFSDEEAFSSENISTRVKFEMPVKIGSKLLGIYEGGVLHVVPPEKYEQAVSFVKKMAAIYSYKLGHVPILEGITDSKKFLESYPNFSHIERTFEAKQKKHKGEFLKIPQELVLAEDTFASCQAALLERSVSIESKQGRHIVGFSDIDDADLYDYELINSPALHQEIQGLLTVPLSELSTHEQLYLIKYLKGLERLDLLEVRKFARRYGANGLRIFLSLHDDQQSPAPIVSFGNMLDGDTDYILKDVFGKYVQALDSLEGKLKDLIGPKTRANSDHMNAMRRIFRARLSRFLIRFATLDSEFLVSRGDRGDFFDNEVFTKKIQEVDFDADVFVSVFKAFREKEKMGGTGEGAQSSKNSFALESIRSTSLDVLTGGTASLTEEDRNTILELQQSRYASKYNASLMIELTESLTSAMQNPNCRFYIYRKGGKILSYVRFESDPAKPDSLHMASFMTNPEYEGGSIGQAMLEVALKKELEKGLPIHAECDPSLVPFYAKYGFQEVLGGRYDDHGAETCKIVLNPTK